VEWRPPDPEITKELEALRARLAAAQREEQERRDDLEQLRKDFARLSEELRKQREGGS
jgi:predicted nuclease with TOPRIM domain